MGADQPEDRCGGAIDRAILLEPIGIAYLWPVTN